MATVSRKQANADALYEASRRAFKRGKNKKAIRLFNAYLRRKPCAPPKPTAELRELSEKG